MNRRWIAVVALGIGAFAACPLLTSNDAAWAVSAPAGKAGSEFPDNYYFPNRPAGLIALEGKPAPAISVKNWIGDEQKLADLKGKVVIVDLWATWCGPCIRSLPHNVEMMKAHEKNGLMIIGVHDSKRGSEKMAKVATDLKINYPLAVDDNNKTAQAYKITFLPTYVVIDRKGVVRAAGLQPGAVEDVVKKLLAEKADKAPSPPKHR